LLWFLKIEVKVKQKLKQLIGIHVNILWTGLYAWH